ncbi:type II toxin-antitoxin system VapC family toxin [Xaviernesmea oryzae]|uniref:type II toxin-antitoxin system VapC family toxin n=1 Tax=Xaviernesmea oryzae TaxID=464029 RepID=UPI0008D0FFE4|nr:type II toxin-antitoxin system VapC family toxin [Xaviernesmea oryzae]SEL88659.1 Uncharacterized protein, contains PIN domain [Xaviernesmea oryzae]
MFIDTSVIVALLVREPDWEDLIARIENSAVRYTCALVVLEAAMRLSSLMDVDPRLAETRIDAFLKAADVTVLSIPAEAASIAIEAFAIYGKGRGHPAQLNLADCMVYACAKQLALPLLSKVLISQREISSLPEPRVYRVGTGVSPR